MIQDSRIKHKYKIHLSRSGGTSSLDPPKAKVFRRAGKEGLKNKMEEIIKILRKRHWTIGVMESCTGGAVANCITNIPGASDVFRYGWVTYSDEAKIEAGVDQKIIKKYGVYSKETAEEMAKKAIGIVGVGVTGNLPGNVFVAVRMKDRIISEILETKPTSLKLRRVEARIEMKEQVVEKVIEIIVKKLL